MKQLYILGTILLFLGLLWMFLPHALHQKILNEKEERSHIGHIFQGGVLVILGLGIIIKSNKERFSLKKVK